MISKLPSYIFLLLLSVLFHELCFAADFSDSKGPIELRNQYPLESSRLTIAPHSALLEPQGTFKAKISAAWSNTFNRQGGSYRVDVESREFRLDTSYSITDNLELSAEVPLHWSGGGILDHLLDEFHKTFGFPRAGRNDVDDNVVDVSGVNLDGSSFDIEREGFGVGNPILSFRAGISESPKLTLTGSISLPAPSGEFGQQSVDLSTGLLYSTELEPVFIHLGASYIFLSDDTYQGISYQQHQGAGFLSLELPISKSLSFLVSSTISSPTIKSIQRFPDYSIYLDTGLKWDINERYRLEVLLRENPAPRFGTTDVTFYLGLEFTI